jgi:hypothetical protein
MSRTCLSVSVKYDIFMHSILYFTDEKIILTACASPNYNCRVMTALMTSYFPQDTPLSKVISDTNQMLDIIADEMATGDWNGVTVSYNRGKRCKRSGRRR